MELPSWADSREQGLLALALMQRTALTILHQDLNLISQGQCAQLGHGQDIAGSYWLVSVRRRGEWLEKASGR